MLLLTCPHCGAEADETELAPGGEAHVKRAAGDASDDAFQSYLFDRKSPKGVHFERWRHAYGCGKWFIAARDTVSMRVYGTYPAQSFEPPEGVTGAIVAHRPDWTYAMWLKGEGA